MQRLHNQHMIDVDHPRMSGVRIQVPGKIFRALMLLDIFIPNWAFNGFSGYIISSGDDAAEGVDALERTAEWSRLQGELEDQGIDPAIPRVVTGRRGRRR